MIVMGEPGVGKTYFCFSAITPPKRCYYVDLEGPRAHYVHQTEYPYLKLDENIVIKNCRVVKKVKKTVLRAGRPRTIIERITDPVPSLKKLDEAITDLFDRMENGERFDVIVVDGLDRVREWGVDEFLADKGYDNLTEKNLAGWRYANTRLKSIAETFITFQEIEACIVILASRMKDKYENKELVGTELALKRDVAHLVHIIMKLEKHEVGSKDDDGMTLDYGEIEHWASFSKCSFGRIKNKYLDITYPIMKKVILAKMEERREVAMLRVETKGDDDEVVTTESRRAEVAVAQAPARSTQGRSKKAARRSKTSSKTQDDDG